MRRTKPSRGNSAAESVDPAPVRRAIEETLQELFPVIVARVLEKLQAEPHPGDSPHPEEAPIGGLSRVEWLQLARMDPVALEERLPRDRAAVVKLIVLFGLDSARLARRWKDPERLRALLLAGLQREARRHHAFLEVSTGMGGSPALTEDTS